MPSWAIPIRDAAVTAATIGAVAAVAGLVAQADITLDAVHAQKGVLDLSRGALGDAVQLGICAAFPDSKDAVLAVNDAADSFHVWSSCGANWRGLVFCQGDQGGAGLNVTSGSGLAQEFARGLYLPLGYVLGASAAPGRLLSFGKCHLTSPLVSSKATCRCN